MNETKMEHFNQKYLERIARLRLLDDDFMSKVFEDEECTEVLLQTILNRKDLKVLNVDVQYPIKNLQGRSVRLDIIAKDTAGKMYNVEVQRNDRGADVKRARYNSGVLDANITEPGDEYEALKETYVIFITERDVLKGGLPIYHIDRTILETGKPFGDGSHIIYVNAQITDETELGRLMQDFHCTDAGSMNNPVLARRVRYFKEEQEGVSAMCRELEQMCEEVREETTRDIMKKHISNMLRNAFTKEQIQRALNVPAEEIDEVERELLLER